VEAAAAVVLLWGEEDEQGLKTFALLETSSFLLVKREFTCD
jgi:hypothetical protein